MNIFNSCGQTYCDICRFNVILEVDTPSALRNHFYFSSGVNKSCNYLTDYLLSSIGNMLRNWTHKSKHINQLSHITRYKFIVTINNCWVEYFKHLALVVQGRSIVFQQILSKNHSIRQPWLYALIWSSNRITFARFNHFYVCIWVMLI